MTSQEPEEEIYTVDESDADAADDLQQPDQEIVDPREDQSSQTARDPRTSGRREPERP